MSINFKLVKRKILNRKLCLLVLIFILFIQIGIEFISVKEKSYNKEQLNVVENNKIEVKDKNLSDLINELNYNNICFSEIRKAENGYNIKVIVEGSAEIFKEKLKYINKYSIKDYELKIKNDNIKVIATLNY